MPKLIPKRMRANEELGVVMGSVIIKKVTNIKAAPVAGASVVINGQPEIRLLKTAMIKNVPSQLKQRVNLLTRVAIKNPKIATPAIAQILPPQRPGTTSIKCPSKRSPVTIPKLLGLKIGLALSGVLKKCFEKIDIALTAA